MAGSEPPGSLETARLPAFGSDDPGPTGRAPVSDPRTSDPTLAMPSAPPASATPSASAKVDVGGASGPRVVREVGGFEILARLGEGGMGQVFKARQRSLDRHVALKVLTPKLASNVEYVQRFELEAKAAAQLNHPNIVQVIEQGFDTRTNVRFIAFEFIDGSSLEGHLKKVGRLSERDALRLIRDVAEALRHAQDKGLIHRDVKPDNILLTRDGTPKLADLGLAKMQDDQGGKLTQTGIVMGTPHYMAPEQALGERDLDARADVYALGLVFYRAITGQLPWNLDTALAILTRHINEDCPDPRKVVPEVSEAAVELLRDMTARDRNARLMPAEAAERALAILSGSAATPVPATTASPAASGRVGGSSRSGRAGPAARGAVASSLATNAPVPPPPPALPPAKKKGVSVALLVLVSVVFLFLGLAVALVATRRPKRLLAPAISRASRLALDPEAAEAELQAFQVATEPERATIESARRMLKDVGELATFLRRLGTSATSGDRKDVAKALRASAEDLEAFAKLEAADEGTRALRVEAAAWAHALGTAFWAASVVGRWPEPVVRPVGEPPRGALGGSELVTGWREALATLVAAVEAFDAGDFSRLPPDLAAARATLLRQDVFAVFGQAVASVDELAKLVQERRKQRPEFTAFDAWDELAARRKPQGTFELARFGVVDGAELAGQKLHDWTSRADGIEGPSVTFPRPRPALTKKLPFLELAGHFPGEIPIGTRETVARVRLHVVREAGSVELVSAGRERFLLVGTDAFWDIDAGERVQRLVPEIERKAAAFKPTPGTHAHDLVFEESAIRFFEDGRAVATGNVSGPRGERIGFQAVNLRLERITFAYRR